MQLNPQSGVFDRALILVIALMSVLGLLTVVLPASKPLHGGPSRASFRKSAVSGGTSSLPLPLPGTTSLSSGAPVAVSGAAANPSDTAAAEEGRRDLSATADGDTSGEAESPVPSESTAYSGASAHVANLGSIQVRHELERVGKLVGEAEAAQVSGQSRQDKNSATGEAAGYFRSSASRSLRLLRGLVRRIALGESRQMMVEDFRREAGRKSAVDLSDIADFKDTQQQRISIWLRRLESWAGRDGDRDGYLNEARSSYFHAMGLSNTGQHLDAYLEFALALEGFRRFIELNPSDERVPESLYLLGVAYLNLREVLPPSVMGERFLMMCTDYFGESVWGSQARQIWAPARGGESRASRARRSHHAL